MPMARRGRTCPRRNADATALYVVLLDEYERWTGDTKLVRGLEHAARAAREQTQELEFQRRGGHHGNR